jgi:TM2 domain-containing membrane protein YozV
MKDKTTAGLLALFLGGLGIHKFYLGRGGQGIVYLLFAWTFIPAIIGFIEAIILFTMNEQEFHLKYNPQYALSHAAAQPQNIVVNVANTASSGSVVDELSRSLRSLRELRESGDLTEEEYQARKQKLLAAAE